MTQKTTTRRSAKLTQKPYKPAALFRVYDKTTGACLGYLAPSRDGSTHYQVTCDDRACWHCTCPATVECVHIKAAKELCKIRAEKGQPGCFQGRATAGVETEESKEEQVANSAAIDELIDPQLPEQPAPPARELRIDEREGRFVPQWREDGDRDWSYFTHSADDLRTVMFRDRAIADLFIAEDTEEHRAAVLRGEIKPAQPAPAPEAIKEVDDASGTLHSAAKGSFLDMCFGSLRQERRAS